ncbi:MAG: hypothetical protein FWC71_00560 [Defluviitaleaceae bacterium]|nr:hypothetical protein [Defluviitaleaceae bacterium]
MLRKWIIPVLIGLFNITLLLYPRVVLLAAREGLLLWFLTVLPSLLPFMIATNLLIKLGVFGKMNSEFAAFLMGLVSGYPMGAKTVGDMYRTGDIEPQNARWLLSFCNNAGPLFIVGVVGMGMFGSASVGYALWITHVLAALTIGAFGWFKKRNRIIQVRKKTNFEPESPPIGRILSDSVKNAMEAMALVGGLIIFFNVAAQILRTVLAIESPLLMGFFAGFLEVTGGARMVSSQNVGFATLALAAAIIGFGGLSVHAQALHFIAGTGMRPAVYFMYKALHGLLAAGLMALAWLFFPLG